MVLTDELKWIYVITAVMGFVQAAKKTGIVDISSIEQESRRHNASVECAIHIFYHPSIRNGTHCPAVWDEALCWPETPAGVMAFQPCPNYIKDFNSLENASKYCQEDGTWYFNSAYNLTWTDFTKCMTNPTPISDLYINNMGRLRLMYNIGYGISLASLLLAVGIMVRFKRLHCSRNTIHINLFASFILRASISFMKENLLVQSVGFSFDVEILPNGNVSYITEGMHWQCKLFFTLFNYILGANYMWIFVEALYLHILITVSVFSDRSGIKWYILFGWLAPVCFVIPWVIVRATVEDVLCWNTHPTPEYFWITKAPIVASIVINFIIFLNLIRVLFTKLNAVNSPEAKKFRYPKLAKSTLVLIPLFGVHYIVFLGLPDGLHERLELAKLYFEMFFNSVQGFFVALLFCFLNSEVQNEIKKNWHRFKLTRLSNFDNGRSHFHTFATYLTKVRGSVSSLSNEDKDGKAKGSVCEATALNIDNMDSRSRAKNGSIVKNATVEENMPMMILPATSDNCDNVTNSVHNGHL